jgi:hypothetical protein
VSQPAVFIEVNPFHAVTLFPLHASLSTSPRDVVLGHARLFGQELFDEIQAPKEPFSVRRLVRFILGHQVRRCYFNTINFTLTPITGETTRLNALTLLLPFLTRMLGCRNSAVVHEADQFFATGIDSCRRHAWFRRAIGRWFIRLFDERFVLAPEVADFLTARGIAVRLLDCRSLVTFASPPSPTAIAAGCSSHVLLSWIGPIVSHRRNWRALVELTAAELDALRASFVMLCDSRVGEGQELRAAVRERGLERHFIFLDARPDDRELFSSVDRSTAVVCLYAGPEYGTTKTSGARLIASAFRKPFIATNPSLGVYDHEGAQIAAIPTLRGCIERIAQLPDTLTRSLL